MVKHVARLNAQVRNCIELISGIRTPSYQFEDFQACMQFNCWLRFPHSEEMYEFSTALACATLLEGIEQRIIKGRSGTRQRLEQVLHSLPIRRFLLSPPLQTGDPAFVNFAAAFAHIDDDLVDVDDILRFFLMCPVSDKPSLNKAMFFIDAGGFVDRNNSADDQRSAKASISKLKQSWVKYATVAPFIVAAQGTDDGGGFQDILRMPPDNIQSIRTIKNFLSKRADSRDFFGIAKYYQGILLSRLDDRSRNRFDFITFTDSIEPVEVECDVFNENERQVLKSYASQNFKRSDSGAS